MQAALPLRLPRMKARTLAKVPGEIHEFAQTRRWMVYAKFNFNRPQACTKEVMIRRVSGGAPTSLVGKRGPTCTRELGDVDYSSMALAGTRALWVVRGPEPPCITGRFARPPSETRITR
jgi:hypothetical protein